MLWVIDDGDEGTLIEDDEGPTEEEIADWEEKPFEDAEEEREFWLMRRIEAEFINKIGDRENGKKKSYTDE